MNWKQLKKEEAKVIFNEYVETHEIKCPKECVELRDDLIKLYEETKNEIDIKGFDIKRISYMKDLLFGLKIYSALNEKYGMDVRIASTDGVWMFLSLCVVPDIVEDRYGIDHPDRFWEKNIRIWLRVIWWYIHLSWQGSKKKTFDVLRNNTTDEILQLVDRRGREGYRVSACREIMRVVGSLKQEERTKRSIFRKMMVLNTAWSQVIDPDLTTNGCRGYAESLYQYFSQ